jgi:transposase
VTGWQARYARSGIGGLSEEARSGRPRTVDHGKIVAATLKAPPKKLGVTHWSSRLLAARLGIRDTPPSPGRGGSTEPRPEEEGLGAPH